MTAILSTLLDAFDGCGTFAEPHNLAYLSAQNIESMPSWCPYGTVHDEVARELAQFRDHANYWPTVNRIVAALRG